MHTDLILAYIEHDAGYPRLYKSPREGQGYSGWVRPAIRRVGAHAFGLWAAKHRIPARFILESLHRTQEPK